MNTKLVRFSKPSDPSQSATTDPSIAIDQQQEDLPVAEESQVWNNISPQKPTAQKRMSITLSRDVIDMLIELAESQGITQNDAIKKAIATEWYFRTQMKQGAKVLIQTPEKEIREVVLR